MFFVPVLEISYEFEIISQRNKQTNFPYDASVKRSDWTLGLALEGHLMICTHV